jgi:DNA-binding beta-propeller fold protein YncE
MGMTFRVAALTTLMITGLTTVTAAVAPAPAVSALTAPAAAPGTKLWTARFQGLKRFSQPAATAASPNGAAVFVTGFTTAANSRDRYATVGYNALTGARLWSSVFHQGPKGDSSEADDVAVSPDGSKVFVTGFTPDGLATVAYDAATGAKLWVKDVAGAAGTGVAVSPDGATLYVSGFGRQGTGTNWVTFAYTTASGALRWKAHFDGAAGQGAQVAVSPDGSELFLRGITTNAAVTVAYNAMTGKKLWAQLFSGLGQASSESFAVSPDSSTVFVLGTSSPSASVPRSYATVAYHAKTGRQRWVRYDPGLSSTQFGRTFANSIAVKPDGTAVFVTGENTEANGTGGYSTIAYDAATGTKLWQQRYFAAGRGGEAAEASFAGVSPDGSEVFVTGLTHAGRFATFGYDATSGAVLWSTVYRGAACAEAEGAVNPVTPEVMVTGSCRSRTSSSQSYLTVAYSG